MGESNRYTDRQTSSQTDGQKDRQTEPTKDQQKKQEEINNQTSALTGLIKNLPTFTKYNNEPREVSTEEVNKNFLFQLKRGINTFLPFTW